ncbi:MAG: glucose-1-phosphate adenylyltransferase [Proteobacteria bacterium]|nr:glucose-1-phosphate adenylyltransferase [Pseudomonadota bacterium]
MAQGGIHGGENLPQTASVLVVDDERDMCELLCLYLEQLGYDVCAVDNGQAAIDKFAERSFELAIVDLRMEGIDGLEVLQTLQATDPQTSVVIMTGHGSVETAVQVMKEGAYDYILKPFRMERMAVVVARAVERCLLLRTESKQHITEALRSTIAVVLAGGRGSRLSYFTEQRAKPAMPFGGVFRVIDFPLSNCINSGIRRVGVLTQYESHDLIQHLQRGWNFLRADLNEFVETWPAQQQTDSISWYLGSADAVYQNLRLFSDHDDDYVLILAGDHVYRQDYSVMLSQHLERRARATVAYAEVPVEQASVCGVMKVARNGRVIEFVEKPASPESSAHRPGYCLASMGIYLFDSSFLVEQLRLDAANPLSSHEFGKDILPALVKQQQLMAHRFSDSCVANENVPDPYWCDLQTLDAYWEANLDLTAILPALDLYDQNWPIRTYQERRPPAKFVYDHNDRRGVAVGSLISAGSIVSGSMVRRSLLGTDVRVHSHCVVEDSIILGSSEIGRHSRLRKVIVDLNCRIPRNCVVGEDPLSDARRFYRTAGGVTIITQDMLDAL